jgi:3-hydroxybutyryl-CoA dehydrogenase
MRLGLNHPRGPFEWGRDLGPDRVLEVLHALSETGDVEIYRPAPLLGRWAATGTPTPPLR